MDRVSLSKEIVDLIRSNPSKDEYEPGPKYRKAVLLAETYKSMYGGRGLIRLLKENYHLMPDNRRKVQILGACFLDNSMHINHETKPGYYHYIGFNQLRFLNILNFLKFSFKNIKSFIDVGSGPGDKALLSHLEGYKSSGIEVSSETSRLGQVLLNQIGISIINEDVFNIDRIEQDLVYFYHPIADRELYSDFFLHLVKIAKPGAILVEVLPSTISYILSTKKFLETVVIRKTEDSGFLSVNNLSLDYDGSLRDYSSVNTLSIKELEEKCIKFKGR